MNVARSAIGSILNATESQFVALYKQKYPTQQAFIQDCQLMKEASTKQTETLRNEGIELWSLTDKLRRVINKAEDAYGDTVNKQDISGYFDVDVEEDGSFKIQPFFSVERQIIYCPLCDYYEDATYFDIENKENHRKIRVHNIALHVLEHGCTGMGSTHIDLLRLNQVLNSSKQTRE